MNYQMFKGIDVNNERVFKALEVQFNANQSQVLAKVPWLIAELIEAVGFEATMRFVDEMGGTKIYINKGREEFAKKFNFPVTEKLFDRISYLTSGEYLEVPSTWGVFEKIRSALVSSAFEAGMQREEIRDTYGVSCRFLTNLFKHNNKETPGIESFSEKTSTG